MNSQSKSGGVDQDYFTLCEQLWRDWLRAESSKAFAKETGLSQLAGKPFDFAFAPEPYLRFSVTDKSTSDKKPLHFLFTNPGGGRRHQRRRRILNGKSCITDDTSYDVASRELGSFYRAKLKRTAHHRIEAMIRVAHDTGHDSALQFESIPFHSESLPGKRKLPDLMKKSGFLRDYADSLAATLEGKSVICLSAVPTSRPITVRTVAQEWLRFQAELIGIQEVERLKIASLVRKKRRTTCAFLYESNGDSIRGFVLMMGGNHFPGADGLKKLADVINAAVGV